MAAALSPRPRVVYTRARRPVSIRETAPGREGDAGHG
jgi:hypothetical protein